jgi:hypothetical protein
MIEMNDTLLSFHTLWFSQRKTGEENLREEE